MITVRKLFSLKPGTRQRKIIRVLADWERDIDSGALPDSSYLRDFMVALKKEDLWSRYIIRYGDPGALPESPGEWKRLFNRLRHEMMEAMGMSAAEWDLINPEDGNAGGENIKFPAALYLDEIRSPFNLGSLFRSAECLGVSNIFLSPGCADPDHPRAQRSAMGCTAKIPWKRMDYKSLSKEKGPFFAMELGGSALADFDFPRSGILIVGSEELGVSPECMTLAEQSRGIVTIPLFGDKASLNVSVAFGIVMNAWAQKLSGA